MAITDAEFHIDKSLLQHSIY